MHIKQFLIFHSKLDNFTIIQYKMESQRNTKNIQANLDFLKRFEGKRSVITKDGLISSLQNVQIDGPVSPLKLRKNRLQNTNEKQQIDTQASQYKLTNTEPSANYYNFSSQVHDYNYPQTASVQKKRIDQSFKQSNRTERLMIVPMSQQNYEIKLVRDQWNQSDKLPRVVRSQSDRNFQKKLQVEDYCKLVPRRERKSCSVSNSDSSSRFQVRYDANAGSYLQQLQKFEANLRNIKLKFNRNLNNHY